MPDDELVIPTDKKKFFLVLVLMLLFTAIGFSMVKEESSLKAWFCFSVSFFGTIVTCVILLPNSGHLRLTKDGFTMRSLFRDSFTPWSDVESFSILQMYNNGIPTSKMIGLHYSPDRKGGVMKGLSRAISDCDGAIPGSYKIKAEDLLDTLYEWKQRSESS